MNGGMCNSGTCRWTVRRDVVADGDDGAQSTGGSVALDTNNEEVTDDDQWVGFRFGALGIPDGSTIQSAVVRLQNIGDRAPAMDIFVEGTAYPDVLAATSNNLSRRVLPGQASVRWASDNDVDTSSGRFVTADFGSLVQSSLDNGTLQLDSPLHVLMECSNSTGDTDVDVSFREDGGTDPELVITVRGPIQ